MYVKYVTISSPTASEVLADFAALACGATIASLSNSCNKVNSSIISNAVAPGWTMVDPLGPVISCPDADGIVTKKVQFQSPGSTSVTLRTVETWDVTTHATTNSANSPALGSPGPTLSGIAVNTYHLIVTPRTIYFFTPTGLGVGVGCIEYSRDAAHLKGSVYPCHAIINHLGFTAGQTAASSRIKKLDAGGDTTAPASFIICTVAPRTGTAGSSANSAPVVQFRDATESLYYEVRPLFLGWVGTPTVASKALILGKVFDFVETASVAGNLLNTFTDGVDTWTIVTDDSANPNACVAIKAI